MNYYEILEVTVKATPAEIKASYYRLSKGLHPDKLPPEVPRLARDLIEEKYKQINEAYSVLSDFDSRRKYDLELRDPVSYRTDPTPASQGYKNNHYNDHLEPWFDEDQLRASAEALKQKLFMIEVEAKKNYTQKIHAIIEELNIAIERIGYEGDITSIPKIPDKGTAINQGMLIGILGLCWMIFIRHWFYSLIGLGIIMVGVFKIIYGVQLDPLRNANILKVKKLQIQLNQQRIEGLQQQKEEISIAKNEINTRIRHFQSIPLTSIDREFVNSLSPEDQVLLLAAIQKMNEQPNAELNDIIRVALGVGSVAILLGLGALFGNL
jgi:type IV secretory pathway TrbD component